VICIDSLFHTFILLVCCCFAGLHNISFLGRSTTYYKAVWRHHYNQTSLSFQQPYYTPQHPRMLYAPRVNPQLAYSFESGNPTTDEYQEATVEDVSNDFAEPT